LINYETLYVRKRTEFVKFVFYLIHYIRLLNRKFVTDK